MKEKYIYIFFDSFKQTIKNRSLIISKILLYFIFIFIFSYFWKSVFNGDKSIAYTYIDLIKYLTVTEWILISIPEIQTEIEEDFRTGNISCFLTKPLSYIFMHLARGLGILAAHLLTIGMVGWIFVGYTTDFSFGTISNLLILPLIGFFAGGLGVLFQLLVGLTAFWFHEVAPINWIWQKLLFMFGGLLIPLKLYPEWMQKIASYLPFSAILNQPGELAIHYSETQAVLLLSTLLGWILLVLLIVTGLYVIGLRSLTIHNG